MVDLTGRSLVLPVEYVQSRMLLLALVSRAAGEWHKTVLVDLDVVAICVSHGFLCEP